MSRRREDSKRIKFLMCCAYRFPFKPALFILSSAALAYNTIPPHSRLLSRWIPSPTPTPCRSSDDRRTSVDPRRSQWGNANFPGRRHRYRFALPIGRFNGAQFSDDDGRGRWQDASAVCLPRQHLQEPYGRGCVQAGHLEGGRRRQVRHRIVRDGRG